MVREWLFLDEVCKANEKDWNIRSDGDEPHSSLAPQPSYPTSPDAQGVT